LATPQREKEPEPRKTDVPMKEPVPIIREPEPVPIQPGTVVRKPEPTHASEPVVKAKELTPVKEKEPEKINENLPGSPSNDKKTLISSPAPTAKKLPKKMQFKGKKGRQRTEAEVTDLLTFVQSRNGAWPNDNYVSEQMRRYYRREYPEYFRKGKKGKKVQAARSAPIDISARRAGASS